MDLDQQRELEAALKATLAEHNLKLDEVTWKKHLVKRTISLGLKVSGDLDQQLSLLA